MISVKEIRRRLKTARGQLLLFGAAYCGAVVMAVGALCLKPLLFEPYIRHRLPPLSGELKAAAEEVASGAAAVESLQEIPESQLAALYGGLMNGELEDSNGRLIQGLIRFRSEILLDRLRATVATGSRDQKLQALRMLDSFRGDDRGRAIPLSRAVLDRAIRTGDASVRQVAERVVRHLNSDEGENSDER